jgi:hypothetical protein
MRRKRNYTDYLQDILDAAQKAEHFIAGVAHSRPSGLAPQ